MEKVIYINKMEQCIYSYIVCVVTNMGSFNMDARYPLFEQFINGLLKISAKDNLPKPKCSSKSRIIPGSILYKYTGMVEMTFPYFLCWDGDGEPVYDYVRVKNEELQNDGIFKSLLKGWKNFATSTITQTKIRPFFNVVAEASVVSFKSARTQKEWKKLTDAPW